MRAKFPRIPAFIIITVLFLTAGTGYAQDEINDPASADDRDIWRNVESDFLELTDSIGFTPLDLEQPRWYTYGYTTIGRMPLVDISLALPHKLPEIAIYFDDRVRDNPESLSEIFATAEIMADVYESSDGTWSEYILNPEKLSAHPLYLDVLPDDIVGLYSDINALEGLTADLKSAISVIVTSTARASQLRDSAFLELTPEEITRMEELLPQYFLPGDETTQMFRAYTAGDLDECIELAYLLMKVDWQKMLEAGRIMALSSDVACHYISQLQDGDLASINSPLLLSVHTSIGLVIIGGTGDNTWTQDCAVLIDLGGNDTYLNNAGSSSPTGFGASTLIDLSGDDLYSGDDFVQGTGAGGIGVLMDLEGNDTYDARHYSQGTALAGFSIFNECSGDDTYTGDLGNQCNAIFGYSIFREAGGNDTYRVQSMGQGFASTLGVAILSEQGGNDTYASGGKYGFYHAIDSSCAQGAASGMRIWPPSDKYTVYGGVSLISDSAGDDNYLGYSFVQGASYILGLGMFVDSTGNDVYTGESYVQGSGCHISSGVFVDRNGNDIYRMSNAGTGFSLDRSSSAFVDFRGNDMYGGGGQDHGGAVKPHGVAIFLDASGNDSYPYFRCGHARETYSEYSQSIGVFFDLIGLDDYSLTDMDRENGTVWQHNEWGFGFDYDEYILTPQRPSWWMPYYPVENKRPDSSLGNLGSDHTLVRFQGYDDVINADDPFNEIQRLAMRSERFMDMDIHDIVDILRIRGEISDNAPEIVAGFLESPNPNLRLSATVFFDKVTAESDETIEALTDATLLDTDYRVRSMACMCLGDTENPDVVPALLTALTEDEHWEVRRRAAIALGNLDGGGSTIGRLIEVSENDPDYRVRTRAVASLAEIADAAISVILQSSLSDESGFVRQQAAIGLIEKCMDSRGIWVLIDLMDPAKWPELRTVIGLEGTVLLKDLVGRNINGHEAWSEWYYEYIVEFDIESALEVREMINDARAAWDNRENMEVAEEILRDVLEINPEHEQAASLLAEILNSHAWGLLVSGEDIEYGVTLAEECVGLSQNPNYMDTLAVLLYVSGDVDRAYEVILQAYELASGNSRNQISERIDQFDSGNIQY